MCLFVARHEQPTREVEPFIGSTVCVMDFRNVEEGTGERVPIGRKSNSKGNFVTHHAGASTTCVDALGRPPCLLAGLPTRKVATENEEFPANLNDRNAVFFNDSAEMPDRKPCEFGGSRNIQKHFRSGRIGGGGLSQHQSFSFLSTCFIAFGLPMSKPFRKGNTRPEPQHSASHSRLA